MVPTQLVWFRNDLRTLDHSALSAAASKGPVIGIYLACRRQWRSHDHGASKISFLHSGVIALQEALAELGIPLLYRDINDFGTALETLLEAARRYEAQALHFNREYPLDERERDARVSEAFAHEGLAVHAYTDAIAFEPGELLTGQGEYYKVFTPFAKAWHQRVGADQLALRETPRRQAKLEVASDPIPELPERDRSAVVFPDSASVEDSSWPAGQEAAADLASSDPGEISRPFSKKRRFGDSGGW